MVLGSGYHRRSDSASSWGGYKIRQPIGGTKLRHSVDSTVKNQNATFIGMTLWSDPRHLFTSAYISLDGSRARPLSCVSVYAWGKFMNHYLSRLLPIFVCLSVLVGCQCSEGLETISSNVPKIDICVTAAPGGGRGLLRGSKSGHSSRELLGIGAVCTAGA